MNNYAFISPGIILRFSNEEVREIVEKTKHLKESSLENRNCREQDFSFFEYRGESICWMAYTNNHEIMKGGMLDFSVMLAGEHSKIKEENENVQPKDKREIDTEVVQDCEEKEEANDKHSQ